MTRLLPLLACCAFISGPAHAESAIDTPVTAERILDTVESIFTIPPGARRSHLKPGICVAGRFVGTRKARRYSTAELFSGRTIPVVGRFSLAGSNRNVSDSTNVPRGMALAFGEDGSDNSASIMRMAMLSTPVFGVSSPEGFLAQLEAGRPDPQTRKPNPERIAAFQASHPDTEPLRRYLAAHPPAPDYSSTSFHSVHSFYLVDRNDQKTAVRWRFVPRDKADGQSRDNRGDDFLNDALLQRLQKGPVHWDMWVTIADAEDPVDNPTLHWPEDRSEFRAGTLTLTSATAETGAACEPITFDPLLLPDGIEASGDPVLKMRSQAYQHSLARRLNERQ